MYTRTLIALAVVALLAVSPAHAQPTEITVDSLQEYQQIEGFGTCLVSWVNRMQQLYRTESFQRTYANGVGCNMLRVNLWGPVCDGPVEDWRDIRWQDFDMSVNGGRAQIFVDFGKGIREIDPDAKIIGTVWSPPAWMKENNSIVKTREEDRGARAHTYRDSNNRVLPKYYNHFARWMVEMVKMHDAQGAPLYALSIGNEIQFTQDFESCVWTAEDWTEIVTIVGRMLEEEGYGDVKIYGPETMTSHFYKGGTPDYIEAIVNDPQAFEQLDVFATHGYSDNGFQMDISENSSRRFWDLIEQYDKPFWITEGGTGGHEWPTPLRNGVATGIHNALVAGHCSAFVPWQVIGGARNTHCLMVMEDGEPEFTPKTYAAMHYFRHIPSGSVRIDASPAYGDVMASAFKHEKLDLTTIVLLNPADEAQELTIRFARKPLFSGMQRVTTGDEVQFQPEGAVTVEDGKMQLSMPARSIVTLYSVR